MWVYPKPHFGQIDSHIEAALDLLKYISKHVLSSALLCDNFLKCKLFLFFIRPFLKTAACQNFTIQ